MTQMKFFPVFDSQILVLTSIPGAGKGTQAKILEKHFLDQQKQCEYLGTGRMLRDIKDNQLLFEVVQKKMNQGKLVPDSIIYGLIMGKLSQLPKNQKINVIFDGYPRNLYQAKEFKQTMEDLYLNNILIINISLSDREAIRRIIGRGEEEGRADDKMETIIQRIDIFKKETEPAIRFLEDFYPSVKINGSLTVECVSREIINALP